MSLKCFLLLVTQFLKFHFLVIWLWPIDVLSPCFRLTLFCLFLFLCFSSVQFSHSVTSDSLRPHELQLDYSGLSWTVTNVQASLSITNSWSLLKVMSIELVMPSNNLVLCHPPLLLPSILPSIRVFSSELALHIRWPKYWSFSFSISPSNEFSRLISFRMDWLDLLAVQGTLKSLLQHHSSKT